MALQGRHLVQEAMDQGLDHPWLSPLDDWQSHMNQVTNMLTILHYPDH